MIISKDQYDRIDHTGKWLPTEFALSYEIHLILCSIAVVEDAIMKAMESSKHWCKANKQFKDG